MCVFNHARSGVSPICSRLFNISTHKFAKRRAPYSYASNKSSYEQRESIDDTKIYIIQHYHTHIISTTCVLLLEKITCKPIRIVIRLFISHAFDNDSTIDSIFIMSKQYSEYRAT